MAPRTAVAWLSGLVVAVSVLSPVAGPHWLPPVAVVVPILGGGLLLGRRGMQLVLVVTAAAAGYDIGLLGWQTTRPGSLVVVAICAAFAYRLAGTRERLGVQGLRGESMLVELRDRLQAQGELPALPAGWQCEVELTSANAASFGGDFLVAALTQHGATLEIVLVDVSGKGVDAGTRALLLSGALGGLLGAVEPGRFLPAANDYLLRQAWYEGFATAVHLVVDLRTGEYAVESAGHPPAAQLSGGSGVWHLVDASGPLLGVLPDAEFTASRGVFRSGDAMLLYTDGVVEDANREISVGIDKLLGEAERLVPRGFRGGARRLLANAAPGAGDDRALVLLWRD
jgi:hypothetical protein